MLFGAVVRRAFGVGDVGGGLLGVGGDVVGGLFRLLQRVLRGVLGVVGGFRSLGADAADLVTAQLLSQRAEVAVSEAASCVFSEQAASDRAATAAVAAMTILRMFSVFPRLLKSVC